MTTYNVGDTAVVFATFSAITVFNPVTRTLTDPTTVVCVIQPPTLAKYTLTYGVDAALAKDAAGVFHVLIPILEGPNSSGVGYTARITGTGAAAGTRELSLTVKARTVP